MGSPRGHLVLPKETAFALLATWMVLVVLGGVILYRLFGSRLFANPAFYIGGLLLFLSAAMVLAAAVLAYRRRREAETDGLTGLANQRAFYRELRHQVAAMGDGALSVLMMDVDDFKLCNDAMGHLQGDQLLREIAAELREHVRETDLVARYGGDEFAVIMPAADFETAIATAERLEKAVRRRAFMCREVMPTGCITISVGVGTMPQDGLTAEALVQTADRRMYLNKEQADGQRAQSHLQEILAVVEIIEKLVARKDMYIPGHNQRVGRYATAIGDVLGVQDINLSVAAAIHDLGKVEIPSQLLCDPTPLTTAEGALIRSHAESSATIAEDIGLPEEVVSAVRHHHERFDGSGYPDGLAGLAIPLWSRIIAVADSYDAMTTSRHCHKPKSPQEAVAEIVRYAGSLYDPIVVEAFLARPPFRELAETRPEAVTEWDNFDQSADTQSDPA